MTVAEVLAHGQPGYMRPTVRLTDVIGALTDDCDQLHLPVRARPDDRDVVERAGQRCWEFGERGRDVGNDHARFLSVGAVVEPYGKHLVRHGNRATQVGLE